MRDVRFKRLMTSFLYDQETNHQLYKDRWVIVRVGEKMTTKNKGTRGLGTVVHTFQENRARSKFNKAFRLRLSIKKIIIILFIWWKRRCVCVELMWRSENNREVNCVLPPTMRVPGMELGSSYLATSTFIC